MSMNLSTSTPAAPAGSQNVTFQTDGSGSVSGYIPASPNQLTANNVDLTGQNANISATNLVASPVSGFYRVSAYIIVTTVDGASSTLPNLVITWTDKDNGQAQTKTLLASNTGNTQTTYVEGECRLSVNVSAAIQYSTTSYASGTPGTMKYALHIRVELM